MHWIIDVTLSIGTDRSAIRYLECTLVYYWPVSYSQTSSP